MPEILSRQKDDVLVAQFTCDKILDDVLVLRIGQQLLRLPEQAEGKILLDFQGVEFMSSAMIGKIVVLSKTCRANKIELRMCNVPSSVTSVLNKRRLTSVFTICNSVGEALKDLGCCADLGTN
jgi:anti-sigma B factor antagonist